MHLALFMNYIILISTHHYYLHFYFIVLVVMEAFMLNHFKTLSWSLELNLHCFFKEVRQSNLKESNYHNFLQYKVIN